MAQGIKPDLHNLHIYLNESLSLLLLSEASTFFGGAFKLYSLADRYQSAAHERIPFKAIASAVCVLEMLPWFQMGRIQTASMSPPDCYETEKKKISCLNLRCKHMISWPLVLYDSHLCTSSCLA